MLQCRTIVHNWKCRVTDNWQNQLEYLDFLEYRIRLKKAFRQQQRSLTAEQRIELEERCREHLEAYVECNGLPRTWEEAWIFG